MNGILVVEITILAGGITVAQKKRCWQIPSEKLVETYINLETIFQAISEILPPPPGRDLK